MEQLADRRTMLKVKIRVDAAHTRAVWDAAKRAEEEVSKFPKWKRGEDILEEDIVTVHFGVSKIVRVAIDSLANLMTTVLDMHSEKTMLELKKSAYSILYGSVLYYSLNKKFTLEDIIDSKGANNYA